MIEETKKKNGTLDMTEGNPFTLILQFGLPLLFGLLFQQLYNMVDTIIVGKVLGKEALAAVGCTGSINFMIIGFCIGICNGFAIPVAQSFGAKDNDNLKKFITNCAWAGVFFSTVITVLVCIFARDILVLMDTPESILNDAHSYIFVIFLGIPLIFLYNVTSGILRSLGNSIMPLVFLIFSSLMNIVLDLILIKPMGVAGAAVATISAQGAAGIICLFYMFFKYRHLNFTRGDWRFSGRHALKLSSMGLPMGLQYSITAIGSIILQTSVNNLGEDIIAAVAASIKVNMFLCCPFDAMGSTMATYGGQNVGAGKLDRIGKGLGSCVKIGAFYSVISFAIMFFFGKELALLFVDKSETVIIERMYEYMLANGISFFLLCLVNSVRFMIQGLGFPGLAVIAGICEMFARGIAGFVLVPTFGYVFVTFASPLAWVFADCFLVPAYFGCMRVLKKRQNEHSKRI
ncbi:MAG: MATE family efflux transporter [Lachnospiraceae bacterium]|nr:MATE family efflux transporter [Lachnospiraceae bacterium]